MSSSTLLFEFADQFDSSEFKCIEIDDYILKELKDGKVEIRGREQEEAVLVTSNETYKIRQAEFSNTQLLILPHDNINNEKNDDFNNINNECKTQKIGGAISCHYELVKIFPRLNILYELLSNHLYYNDKKMDIDNDDNNNNDGNITLTFDYLKSVIQASDEELKKGLKYINAIEINNEWKLLDEDYILECFSDIITCILEHSLNFNSVHIDQIIEFCNGYSKEIIEHCIRIHTKEKDKNENGIYCIDPSLTCLFYARQLLRQQPNHKMEEGEFLEKWKDMIPYGMEYNLNIFSGYIILKEYNNNNNSNNNGNNSKYYELFEEKELNIELKDRFDQLFNKKLFWKLEELSPYIQPLLQKDESIDKVLLKYAKIIEKKEQNNKIRLYTSKTNKK